MVNFIKISILTIVFSIFSHTNGQAQSDTTLAHSYLELGKKLQAEMKLDSASFYLKKASVIFEQAAKQNDKPAYWQRYIHCENLLADVLYDMGDYDGSAQHAFSTLKLAVEKLGEMHLLSATAFLNVGNIHFVRDEFLQAAKYFRKSLSIRKQLLGEIHEDVATAYNNLGNTYDDRGEPDSAMVCYQRTLDIRQKLLPESERNIWLSYSNIGTIYYDKGDFKKAVEYFSKSKNLHVQYHGERSRDAAIQYNNLASAYEESGSFDLAVKHYKKSIAIFTEAFGERHPELAMPLMNIGELYSEWGDYDEAVKYVTKAVSVYRNAFGEIHVELGCCYDMLGLLSSFRGQYDQAITYHKKASHIYSQTIKESNYYVAENLHFLGNAYAGKGDHSKALDFYSNALETYTTIDEAHAKKSTIYNEAGKIYLQQAQYEKAEAHFREALALNRRAFGEKHYETGGTYLFLGELAAKQGNIAAALSYYQKSLLAFVSTFDDDDIYANPDISGFRYDIRLLDALNAKANALRTLFAANSDSLEIMQAALSTYEVAAKSVDILRSGLKAEGSKLALAEKVRQTYDSAIHAALELYALTQDVHFKEQAFLFAERSRSAILNEALQESRARQFANLPEYLLEEEQDLRADLVYYETQIQKLKDSISKSDSVQLAEFNNRYFESKTRYNELIENLEQNYPDYYELKYQTSIPSVAEIQNRLDGNTVLLEYFLGENSLCIFTITEDNFDVKSLPLDSDFSETVMSFYRAIKKVDSKTFVETSAQLYQTLIEPVESELASHERLLIIPDGILSYVSFEALLAEKPVSGARPDFTDLDFLIRQHEISYHYSTRLALSERQKSKTSVYDFVGFAPVFREQSENGYILTSNMESLSADNLDEEVRSVTIEGEWFSELSYSEEELASIAKIFKNKALNSRGYFHDTATEENFKQEVGRARYLHIATHGILNEDKPKLSGLIFSQPKDASAPEDGILYAGETFNLNLNADLVVLSSCESGLGRLVKGEGLMALTRGFLYSGAQNVMVSLWKVYDKHTSQLMVAFYENVLLGNSYAHALRKAKLGMLADPKTAFPKKWSAFVLIGSPQIPGLQTRITNN